VTTITPEGILISSGEPLVVRQCLHDALDNASDKHPAWWERFCSGAESEPLRIHVPTAEGVVKFEVRVV